MHASAIAEASTTRSHQQTQAQRIAVMIPMNRIARPQTLRKLVLAATLGAAAMVFAPSAAHGAPAAKPATAPAANRLVADGVGADGKVRVMVNKTTVLTTTQPVKQVSVGNPEVADVSAIGPNNVLVTAKRQGSTQIIIWDDNNRSQVADVIVGMDLEALQSELSGAFPNSKISASSMNGAIALRGQIPDLKTAEQAVSMAQPYSPRVLNLLEVAGGQQVMLQVRFAEVSRRATNQLGVNFAMSDGIFGVGSNVGQVAPSGFATDTANFPGPMLTNAGGGVTLFGGGEIGQTAFRFFVQALRQNNLLRVLAEPNLVAISGQEASFLAGGEFPIPVPQTGTGGGSTITIEYREFGVRLNMLPVVLGDGRIRLRLTPEVSDLDFSSPIVIQGSRMPIINKRTVTTTIELADGQSFAIAGLLDRAVNASKDVTPLLGDIPILGTLFRSTRYERRETELVVLVTPKLVEPMNPNQIPPLPGETWRHPKELDQYLNGDIGNEQAAKPDDMNPAIGSPATGPAGAGGSAPKYRGSYGFTPPPRATTTGATE
jgi:pilus assembly protein CpaC